MAFSPARLAANRRNALKSTGPKTPEGKAVSRLNALRHGMAGAGDLLGADDDALVVAARASSFVAELGAHCEVSRTLAHRAALLAIRMERSSVRDMAATAERVRAARAEFDDDRLDDLNSLIAALEGSGEIRPTIVALEETPEGVDYLLDYWRTLLEMIRPQDPDDEDDDDFNATRAANQAMLGLDLSDDESDDMENAEVADRIELEIARLGSVFEAMAPLLDSIAAARVKAGLLASFDPSPEATLARRYEAAAERGIYRAIKTIAEIRRARNLESAALEAVSTPPPRPIIAAKPEPAASSAALGSFRTEGYPDAFPVAKSLASWVEPALDPIGRRKKRPDLRKLVASGR